MSSNDGYTKTLRFSDELDGKLGKLARKSGRSKQRVFAQMVEYFHRTGKDPADISDELLKTTLVKNHDTYIRFIRAQEEKLLIPVKTEVDRMVQSQVKILDCFNTQILKANKELLQNQQSQTGQLEETGKLLKQLAEKMDTKESLKAKFLHILNQYTRIREGFNFATPAKEKDDLLNSARQQIQKL